MKQKVSAPVALLAVGGALVALGLAIGLFVAPEGTTFAQLLAWLTIASPAHPEPLEILAVLALLVGGVWAVGGSFVRRTHVPYEGSSELRKGFLYGALGCLEVVFLLLAITLVQAAGYERASLFEQPSIAASMESMRGFAHVFTIAAGVLLVIHCVKKGKPA